MSEKIKKIIEEKIKCSSHSIDHVMRVYYLCLQIAKEEENVDYEVLEISALLHDVAREYETADKTGEVEHAALGAEMAEEILNELNFSKIEEVKHCILAHRKRTIVKPETIEAKILFDADKLDCIGAVGIARNLMFAGEHGQKLSLNYEIPETDFIVDASKHNPILEYEMACKYIKDKLYTKTGRKIGQERQKIYNDFFEQLKKELMSDEKFH